MEMLSSATKMDTFPSFLQSEEDFDEDFNYITSSGTTLGEMLNTENFLESYGYDSKTPDDIFHDDVVYDTNDFVAIIKQEPRYDYHDYQMNTSPESEMSPYEDQQQLMNESNGLISVDLEYLMNMQAVPTKKQENENVVVKMEAHFTDDSVPIFSQEAECANSNGLQYIFEGGIVKAEKEFNLTTGFEDIDCVVPSLFMDATSSSSSDNHASQVEIKSEPTIKSELIVKHSATEMSKSPSSKEPLKSTSVDEIIVDKIVSRNQTASHNRTKNPVSKRSAPGVMSKCNKKLKKPDDKDDGDERLKKAVNNVKLRQQKKLEEGRLHEQKRREEEFQKKARERAQYFSKQIASGALQLKPVTEKKPGLLQKKRGRKPKAMVSDLLSSEQLPIVNVISEAFPLVPPPSNPVNSLSDLSLKRSSKGNAVPLATQLSSASSVSSASCQVKSRCTSFSKRSPNVNVMSSSSSVTSASCQMKSTGNASVKKSPSATYSPSSSPSVSLASVTSLKKLPHVNSLPLSLPSISSASCQMKSPIIFSTKRSNVNALPMTVSAALPVTSGFCLMKTNSSVCSSSGSSVVRFASAAVVPAKAKSSSVGGRSGKMSSILGRTNVKLLHPTTGMAKGGISILKSTTAQASPAVANSSSKTLNAPSSDTLVTYMTKAQSAGAQTLLHKPSDKPNIVGTSVLRASPSAQVQNLLLNEGSSVRLYQGKSPGEEIPIFGSVSSVLTQDSKMMTLPGQKTQTGNNKMPDVISGNMSAPDLIKSESADALNTRSSESRLTTENKESQISEHALESNHSLPLNIMTDLADDVSQSSQVSATGTFSNIDLMQDGNNNEKSKGKKKRLNLSEYMNRLKERSKYETSKSKPQLKDVNYGKIEAQPITTSENLHSSYSVLAEHNYCIRPEQTSNDLQSEDTNSSESSCVTSSETNASEPDDRAVHYSKARVTTPALITTAFVEGVNCSLHSDVSILAAPNIGSVDQQTNSDCPVSGITATSNYESLRPKNPVAHNSYTSPTLPVMNSFGGQISSDYESSQRRITFNIDQDDISYVHSTASSNANMVNYASDHVKAVNSNQITYSGVPVATSVGGKVKCAFSSGSAVTRQWKLIPHDLQVTPVVSFKNSVGQKISSSSDHQFSKSEKAANLNQTASSCVPAVTSSARNASSSFDCGSSQAKEVVSQVKVCLLESDCHKPNGDANETKSTSATSGKWVAKHSCSISNSMTLPLPSKQLPFSSCAVTSVLAEANQTALSPVLSVSGPANHEDVHKRRTSRSRRHSQSSRSSSSSSSDSYRSRSPIRSHRSSCDKSSSSSYHSRSPSKNRHHRHYRRNDHRDRSEKKPRSRDFTLDHKDEIRKKTVFIGGIPDNYTPHDLNEKFQHFGEIISVTVHPQKEQENYGFLKFRYIEDAQRAKEEGPKIAGCEHFHFCYGKRRDFCREVYRDFDNLQNRLWDDDVGYYAEPKQSENADSFGDMLRAYERERRRRH